MYSIFTFTQDIWCRYTESLDNLLICKVALAYLSGPRSKSPTQPYQNPRCHISLLSTLFDSSPKNQSPEIQHHEFYIDRNRGKQL